MRVLFVLDSLGAGGTERSTAVLLPHLRDRGVEVSVAVLRSAAEGSEQEVRAAGIDVDVLPAGRTWSQVRSLRRVIRARRPDVIHTALFAADQVGRLASVGRGPRVVSSLVGVPRRRAFRTPADPPAWKLSVVNLVDRVTGRLFVDCYHAVTPGVAELYAKAYRIPRRRVVVVERGRPVDQLGERTPERRHAVRATLGLDESLRVVVAAGRHEHQKAHVDLIAAIGILAARRDDVRLLIAGREGNATPDIRRALAATRGADRSVRLLGHRDDVADLLAAADVMALPSRFEGTAGIALEAMAIGCPIVSTRLDGMLGILDHERDALVVEPADPPAMAAAVERLLDDPALAQRLAASARADFFDRFTMQRCADRMLELYRAVVERRPSTG